MPPLHFVTKSWSSSTHAVDCRHSPSLLHIHDGRWIYGDTGLIRADESLGVFYDIKLLLLENIE